VGDLKCCTSLTVLCLSLPLNQVKEPVSFVEKRAKRKLKAEEKKASKLQDSGGISEAVRGLDGSTGQTPVNSPIRTPKGAFRQKKEARREAG
jgi:hypothetical protein